jgi:hypothetical protein
MLVFLRYKPYAMKSKPEIRKDPKKSKQSTISLLINHKALFILILSLCFNNLAGQSELKIQNDLENDNVSDGIVIRSGVLGNYTVGKNVLESGFQFDRINKNDFNFSAFTINACRNLQIKELHLDLHAFYTLTRYSRILHEYNYGIYLSARHKHFDMLFGTNFRTYSLSRMAVSFYEIEPGNSKIHENFNLMYSFGFLLKAADKKWNAEVSVSNRDIFLINQEFNPFFKIQGYYKINNSLSINAEACYKPAGFLNTHAGYFGYFIRTGIIWKIK